MPRARLRIVLPLIFPMILLVTACGEGGDVQPRDGTWNYVGSEVIDDTCMSNLLSIDPPGSFTLTNNGDGTFTVDDSQNVFDCTLDGSSFTCPSRVAGEIDTGAADADASYNISATGSFSSATAMSGRQEIVLVCEGPDCPLLEATFGLMTPCGWAQEFTASTSS